MALTFKKSPAPETDAQVDELITTLTWPGEIRRAIMSGVKFGIKHQDNSREWKYRLAAQNEVIGYSCDGEIFLGYLALNEDMILVMHNTRVDNPDYTSLSEIWLSFWNLLEQGCRIKSGTEFRVYE